MEHVFCANEFSNYIVTVQLEIVQFGSFMQAFKKILDGLLVFVLKRIYILQLFDYG